LFTFAEIRSLFRDLSRKARQSGFVDAQDLYSVLTRNLTKEGFLASVDEWANRYIALREYYREGEANRLLREFREDETMSRLQ
jgi:hypothetical protein